MAHLKPRKKTPNWVLCARDPITGKWTEETLPLRRDSKTDTAKAQAIARKATSRERASKPLLNAQFAQWVDAFVENYYGNPNTLKRSQYYWNNIWQFLSERKLTHPHQIKYEHADEYLTQRKRSGACHNTARQELKFFSFIMQEALRREYTTSNPLALAKIPKQASKEKTDLNVVQLKAIRKKFKTKPLWMQTVLEICAHLGCRFSEAAFSKHDVDFRTNLIWFTDSKRRPTDPRKRYNVYLPPPLKKYLSKLFKTQELTVRSLSREQNRQFNKAMAQVVPGATSHSLRVAFITRCQREGLTEAQSMKLVNHSNQLVHKIYSKLNTDDLKAAAKRVPPPF